ESTAAIASSGMLPSSPRGFECAMRACSQKATSFPPTAAAADARRSLPATPMMRSSTARSVDTGVTAGRRRAVSGLSESGSLCMWQGRRSGYLFSKMAATFVHLMRLSSDHENRPNRMGSPRKVGSEETIVFHVAQTADKVIQALRHEALRRMIAVSLPPE